VGLPVSVSWCLTTVNYAANSLFIDDIFLTVAVAAVVIVVDENTVGRQCGCEVENKPKRTIV
jgi:hypothetical protein